MFEHVRPRVLFSRCLGFDSCRYNGNIIQEPAVENLKPFVDAETVCPEVALGLGIPRAPIRLVIQDGVNRLLQPETGIDLTDQMAGFVESFLSGLAPCDGAILKYGSPSCGPREVKAYASTARGAASIKTAGLFGGALGERYPSWTIEDEGRLRNFDIRQHFLTRLFALTRYQVAARTARMRDLIAFHAQHKLLLMAYNQNEMRVLGRILANSEKRAVEDVAEAYRIHLQIALSRAPRRNSAINVLMHALGYVSANLTAREKSFFLDALDDFRNARLPLSVPSGLVRSWIVRFDVTYLADQYFFEPFPHKLVEVLDSGKGREVR